MLYHLQAIEQPGGTSDDFQEIGTADNEVLKQKFSMDDALEDKICDLYDLYVQVLFVIVIYKNVFLKLFSWCIICFLLYGFRGWRKTQDHRRTNFMPRYSLYINVILVI